MKTMALLWLSNHKKKPYKTPLLSKEKIKKSVGTMKSKKYYDWSYKTLRTHKKNKNIGQNWNYKYVHK